MSRFIQIHLLTSLPASNPNRDDLGRPKSVRMGGVERSRISSQSLKRNWRISNEFSSSLSGNIGVRTKLFGSEVYDLLIDKGVKEKQALEFSAAIAGVFGKLKKADKNDPKKGLEIEQLAHISSFEKEKVYSLVDILASEGRGPEREELKLLVKDRTDTDIALFGRMLASSPQYNFDASCQVSHAVGVHAASIEDDFFTAVDDLNKSEDSGSSHLGESSFSSTVYYTYLNINKDLLLENLGGNEELANQAIKSLVEASAKVMPSGKQNSYGSRSYASYILAEKGTQSPRNLSTAFIKPISGENILEDSISSIKTHAANMDKVYGSCSDHRCELDAVSGKGSFSELLDFVVS